MGVLPYSLTIIYTQMSDGCYLHTWYCVYMHILVIVVQQICILPHNGNWYDINETIFKKFKHFRPTTVDVARASVLVSTNGMCDH
jgi:hypothetical protein